MDNEVIPIEVKSGKDYKRHVALDNLLKNKDYNINVAYTLCNDNVQQCENRIYLPIYMIMYLKKKEIREELIFKIDISKLKD